MATQQELLDQASEICNAEHEGENTAVRVGTMLLNIIEYMGQFMTSTQLEAALDQLETSIEEYLAGYATIDQDSGLLDLDQSWFVPLATMGALDDSPEEYTPATGEYFYQNRSGYQIFRKTSGGAAGEPAKVGVVYFNKRNGKSFRWDGSDMVELGKESFKPHVIDYYTAPPFADISVGQSFFYTTQSGTRRLAVKTGTDTTWPFDPDPDCIYVFRDTKKTMIWNSSSRAWDQVGGSDSAPVNDLETGGEDKALSAEMGKRLKGQIGYVYERLQAVYGQLGNIAFWNGKPSANTILPDLDWSGPKHTVTLALSLTNAVVKRNGEVVSNGSTIQVEEGSTLTLIVEPASGYALTSVTSSTTGATVTDLGDGTYKIGLTMGKSNVTLSISATGAAAYGITLDLTHCSKVNGPTSIMSGSSATIVFDADDGYALPSTAPAVVGASVVSWDNTTGELVINNATGAVTVTVDAVIATPYQGDLVLWLDGADDNTALASKWVDRIGGVEFPISGAITRSGSHYQFAGTWGQKNALMGSTEDLIFANTDYTVEVVFKPTQNDKSSLVCSFGKQTSNALSGLYFSLNKVKAGESGPYINGMYLDGTTNVWKASEYDVNKIYCFGLNKAAGLQNGTPLTSLGLNHWSYSQGGRWIGSGETDSSDGMGGNAAFVGDIYAVRIYRGQLTAAQMLANQKIDNERYNLGLTLPDSVS